MSGCGCEVTEPETRAQRRILVLALVLNAGMFVVGFVAGVIGQSSGLLADSLDMLADASAYAIAIAALKHGPRFKVRAATFSGIVLLFLGAGILVDAARRGLQGSSPESTLMIVVAGLSLGVNGWVLHMLSRVRSAGVHLSASWIFTRADVVANIGVIASGVIVALTGFRFIDLIVAGAIGLYVIKEACEILSKATKARAALPN